MLKQLEEWHVIVSCEKLGETLQAAPTLLFGIGIGIGIGPKRVH